MGLDWHEKASTLVEALPYIKKFYGKRIVIKYGGNAMADQELKDAIIQDIVLMKYVGIKPVIVHGGGPAISTMLDRVGKETRFIDGLRITDQQTMEIVEMVLAGGINKEIVTLVNRHGGRAVGICGKDGDFIKARKKLVELDGCMKDIGLVGEVEEIDTQVIDALTEKEFIPVIAPIGVGPGGESYNINADYVASALAASLKADKLVFLTDVEGVMDGERLITRLSKDEAERLIRGGTITGGMIPKVMCCLDALEKGVSRVHIINGTVKHSLLLEIFTDRGIGTMIEA